jgi:hypothetical protein
LRLQVSWRGRRSGFDTRYPQQLLQERQNGGPRHACADRALIAIGGNAAGNNHILVRLRIRKSS